MQGKAGTAVLPLYSVARQELLEEAFEMEGDCLHRTVLSLFLWLVFCLFPHISLGYFPFSELSTQH